MGPRILLFAAVGLVGCASSAADGPDAYPDAPSLRREAAILVETTLQGAQQDTPPAEPQKAGRRVLPVVAPPSTRVTARFAARSEAADGPDRELPKGCSVVTNHPSEEGGSQLFDVGARAVADEDGQLVPLLARRMPDLGDTVDGAMFVGSVTPMLPHGALTLHVQTALIPLGSMPVLVVESVLVGDESVALKVDGREEFSAQFTPDAPTVPSITCRFDGGVGEIPLTVDFGGGTVVVSRSATSPVTIPGFGSGAATLVLRQTFAVAPRENAPRSKTL